MLIIFLILYLRKRIFGTKNRFNWSGKNTWKYTRCIFDKKCTRSSYTHSLSIFRSSITTLQFNSLHISVQLQRKQHTFHITAGISNFGTKWGRLSPNGTNLGLFPIKFQTIMPRGSKTYRNLIGKSVELTHKLLTIKPHTTNPKPSIG